MVKRSTGAGHGTHRSPVAFRVLAVLSCALVLQLAGCASSQNASKITSRPRPAPTTTTTAPIPTTTVPPPAPPDIAPLAPGPLSGEGHWVPAGRPSEGAPAVYTTFLRAGPGAPPVGLAWIETRAVRTVVYAGDGEPSGSWTASAEVATNDRPQLIAAFNSGFRIGSSGGGWYSDGRTVGSLVDGAASLVVYADGSATVGQWNRDVQMNPFVTQVRQNLTLLVDGGAPVSDLSPGRWGATLGGGASVWRSGLGVDAEGNMIYAAGPSLVPSQLASVLVAAGAVRAMELDINPEWVSFNTYSPVAGGQPTDVAGTKLLSGMNYSPDHYLSPSSRDFVAVFAK